MILHPVLMRGRARQGQICAHVMGASRRRLSLSSSRLSRTLWRRSNHGRLWSRSVTHACSQNELANRTIPVIPGLIRRVTRPPRMTKRNSYRCQQFCVFMLTRGRSFQISVCVGRRNIMIGVAKSGPLPQQPQTMRALPCVPWRLVARNCLPP